MARLLSVVLAIAPVLAAAAVQAASLASFGNGAGAGAGALSSVRRLGTQPPVVHGAAARPARVPRSDGVAASPPLPTETAPARLTQDKWIGLGLAVSSSLAIGTSFIITKKGLIDAGRGGALASDAHAYLSNPTWWAGMACMVVGEVANFAAYTFAPPVLVTPLGALSVLIGAVLASFVLHEDLGRLGRVGCTLCLVGTLIIILNAPEDRDISTVDEMLTYATQPPFFTYCVCVAIFALVMARRVAPLYGRRTPLVYLSICSSVGSISVMSVKGFGVALKLTMNGNNQFTHLPTYAFALVVAICILVQMNYFNKALDQFSTNVVNPIYYVMFTSSTIFASVLLFRGLNTAGAAPAVSLLCGFAVIFTGVYLLNMNSREAGLSLGTGTGTGQRGASGARARPGWAGASSAADLEEQGSYEDAEAGEHIRLCRLQGTDGAAPLPRPKVRRDVFTIHEGDEGENADADEHMSAHAATTGDDEPLSNATSSAQVEPHAHRAHSVQTQAQAQAQPPPPYDADIL